MSDIDPEVIDEIESVDGLKAVLQLIGRAGMKAQDEGKCILSFEMTSNGLTVVEITEHVAALEGETE
ncbi:hypothetical protein [Halocatena halophila]|uniref:hypothetical protein n=1 Tax=Halocatena halophila TaxID=2814576 RepID=UPI002ED60B80